MKPIVDMVEHQIIAAVRTPEQLAKAVNSKVNIIFLLFGNVFSLKDLVHQAASANKRIFLHLDFIEGIASDKCGVQYIAQKMRPTGVISTRSHLIQWAKENHLSAIQRLFLIDSTAIEKGLKTIHASGADAVEIMPGLMPKVIAELTEMTPLPIIAGGLVRTESEAMDALRAGALAVSVGNSELWDVDW
jgi:glycerol uptake operon antiterminator